MMPPGTRVKPRHTGTTDARNGHTLGTIAEPPYAHDRYTRAVMWQDGTTAWSSIGELVAL